MHFYAVGLIYIQFWGLQTESVTELQSIMTHVKEIILTQTLMAKLYLQFKEISFSWKHSSALSIPTIYGRPVVALINVFGNKSYQQKRPVPNVKHKKKKTRHVEWTHDIDEIKEDLCIRELFFQTLSSCGIIQSEGTVIINFCVLWIKLWFLKINSLFLIKKQYSSSLSCPCAHLKNNLKGFLINLLPPASMDIEWEKLSFHRT